MKARINVGPVNQVTHLDDEILISEPNGRISSNRQQGYFIADTRLISGYRLRIARNPPLLLNSSAVAENSGRFEFTNERFIDDVGIEVPESSLHLELDRVLGRGVHEDYELTNFSDRSVTLILEISIESDFADLFDVKENRLLRRGLINSSWDADKSILLNVFTHDGFVRAVQFEATTSGDPPVYANGGLSFPIILAPRETWTTCLLWRPIISGESLPTIETCHDLLSASNESNMAEPWIADSTKFTTSNAAVNDAVRQALDDLIGLRMRLQIPDTVPIKVSEILTEDMWLPAAGVPWFVSVFGRDALITSLQALHVSYKFAEGSLRALSVLQATDTDDSRDMQPGKIQHELRRGELAELGLIPHTPYYGTHDATPLFVLTVASTWDWHANLEEIDMLRPHVEAALAWVDRDGDADGDGIQEYAPRSPSGYFNQGWKDNGQAILHGDGSLPKLPIATCENQGLVVAAKRGWAHVLEQAYGETLAAQKLYDQADHLADLIEKRFFWEEQNTYYLGLDGDKRPIESVTSNAGQLLYYGAIHKERADLLAKRLFEQDMWSGWGIRTLSTEHPSYNPFSYQLGSVWPHDNVLIAAGFRRYGFDEEAQRIAKAMFDASECFVYHRLPELFSGLIRDPGSFPVQYLGANVPQAWAAGSVVQMISMLLGLEANAHEGILKVSPALPPWLPSVTLSGLSLGENRLDLTVERTETANHRLISGPDNPVKIILYG
ncbi:MAG: amylo-alpha-1,6-glucosidase [Acidimicrobiaceae bacterium]|nr:amylo-alpha-1,6-glucosidase [Acidimicrobiaceae bacterium]